MGLCAARDQPLREAPVLPPEELRRLDEFNQTGRAIECDGGVHELFEQIVEKAPDRVALIEGDRRTVYRDLNRQAESIADRVRATETADGRKPIVICCDRRPAVVAAILGVLKAGRTFCILDRSLPKDRLLRLKTLLGSKIAVGLDEDRERLGTGLAWIDLVQAVASPPQTTGQPASVTPDQPAYVVFTSGSSGEPKAVAVSHLSLANHALSARRLQRITPEDRRLQFASVGSDVFLAEVFNYLTAGASLVFGIGPKGGSIQSFLRFLDRHRITAASTPASYWAQWMRLLEQDQASVPTSLRMILAGMERVDPRAFAIWRRRAPPRVDWFNAYGPTETAITSLLYKAGDSEWEDAGFAPIGSPMANTRALVLDRNRNLSPIGAVGELWIGGAGVAIGYFGRPDLTKERFVVGACPRFPEERLYRTGDRVLRLPDGNLVFLGRTDRQVKIRGYRINLEEVEGAIASHPRVNRAAVTVRDSSSHPWLAAYFSGPPSLETDELARYVTSVLPGYMAPQAYKRLPEMPLTAARKVDVSRLPPIERSEGTSEEYVAPGTPAEKRIAEIFRDILHLQRVSATDDFFKLGGDSLTATALLTALHAEFGQGLALADLWESASPARLAALLASETPALRSQLTKFRSSGSHPPLFCLHALHGTRSSIEAWRN